MRVKDILVDLSVKELDELGDVVAGTPNNGDVLRYNTGSEHWEAIAPPIPLVEYGSRGDIDSHDFTTEDFITDNEWHNLYLGEIVPSTSTFILVRVKLKSPSTNRKLRIRKNGSINAINIAIAPIYVANVDHYVDLWIECDENKVIEYKIDDVAWATIIMTIRGYLK